MFELKKFSQKLDIIFEGGNAPYINRETGEVKGNAHKVSIKELGREKFVHDFTELFGKLNDLYKNSYGEPLWNKFDVITSGHAFNGSSEALFNKEIPTDEFVQHKAVVGDVDITIPHKCLGPLFDLLATLEGKAITKAITYLGQNKKHQYGHQINAVFGYKGYNVQVDFEGSEYSEDKPTEYAKFGHSADWGDIQKGFKGSYHKFLLRNLVRATSERTDIVIVTPASTPEAPRIKKNSELPREMAFSVDLGLRTKITPFLDEKGNQVKVNGKPAYKELSTEQSIYSRKLPDMFKLVFGKTPAQKDVEMFKSFHGLTDLIKKYYDKNVQKKTFEYLLNDLWGKGAQGFERNNPQLDTEIKKKMVDYLVDAFGLSSYEQKIEDMKTEFVKNYKMADIST